MEETVDDYNKEADNYKHTIIYIEGDPFFCERCGKEISMVYIATNDKTNSMWKLCKEDAEAMKSGEAWW